MHTHLGKLRAWSSGGGLSPPDLAAISPEAWTADLPDHLNGITVLGTPFGKAAFVEAFTQTRMEKERALLERIEQLQDPQCAWLMLSMSAVPRANHILRMLPPSQSAQYAQLHDEAIWQSFTHVMGTEQLMGDSLARDIASMPARMGGLGLRSAARMAQAAFWASWVNALPVIKQKQPALAATIKGELLSSTSEGAIAEAATARTQLELRGADLPTWEKRRVASSHPPGRSGPMPQTWHTVGNVRLVHLLNLIFVNKKCCRGVTSLRRRCFFLKPGVRQVLGCGQCHRRKHSA